MGSLMSSLNSGTQSGIAAGSSTGNPYIGAGAGVMGTLGSLFGGNGQQKNGSPSGTFSSGTPVQAPTFQQGPPAIAAPTLQNPIIQGAPSMVQPGGGAPPAVAQGGNQELNAAVNQATMPDLQALLMRLMQSKGGSAS